MKFSVGRPGRTFVISLDHGEILHETIEKFAKDNSIRAASVIIVGGADKSSRLVVGPEDGDARPVLPMDLVLEAPHEICGTGTLFPDDDGNPVLHMHIACGRQTETKCGCVRKGVRIWFVGEVILQEITGVTAARLPDPSTGFKILSPS